MTSCDMMFLALPRWDGQYSSTAFSLAKALSKHGRIFYVDNPFTVKDYLLSRRTAQMTLRKNALLGGKDIFHTPDKKYPNLVVVTPPLTLSINWLPRGFVYDMFAWFNDHVISTALNETIRAYDIRKYILVNSFNPIIGRFLNLTVKPALTVYQSVDDINESKYVNKHGGRLEEQAIRRADFTVVTSSELKRQKSEYCKSVFLLPNAANTAIFNSAMSELDKPKDLQGIPEGTKVICYTGNICHRLDYELLRKVATRHQDKVLLMVGPCADDQHNVLRYLPNVIFVGPKKIEELPKYLKYSHCCIIPFLCNTLTRSIYPLKINEYLSAGKPVVSTSFSKDILSFGEVAYIADSHEAFLSQIETAISEDCPELASKRVAFSSGNNWESRACEFIRLAMLHLGYPQEEEVRAQRVLQSA